MANNKHLSLASSLMTGFYNNKSHIFCTPFMIFSKQNNLIHFPSFVFVRVFVGFLCLLDMTVISTLDWSMRVIEPDRNSLRAFTGTNQVPALG